jgi:hypothetical protein
MRKTLVGFSHRFKAPGGLLGDGEAVRKEIDGDN